jgi:tRNA pseudouridine38-40 synthase
VAEPSAPERSTPEPLQPEQPAQRWRLDIAYDGSGFSGWARQPGLRTVQGELETWTGRVLRLPDAPQLVCAGRTDTGVHARGQVAHVDLPPDALTDEGEPLKRRLARVLPGDLVVRAVRPAPPGFDARFGAVWRRYVYRLVEAGTPLDPLHRSHVAAVRSGLDLAAVTGAAPELLGLRDFGAFCRRREGATTVRTLLELSARRVPSGPLAGVVELTVRADAFCHSMVRSLVGALVSVGSGQRDRSWLAAVTAGAVRASDVQVMPALGLTLEEVGYPADDQLVARSQESRTVREVLAR